FSQTPPKNWAKGVAIGTLLEPIRDRTMLWQTFEKRFGKEKMHEIRSAFRNNFITDKDFERIKKAGFNCVRLPFLYDLIDEPEGLFYWLDKAIFAAKSHGLYVILDMHGTPGRQSSENHTGQIGKNSFFSDPAMIKKTAKIWKLIANAYKTNPVVAGFDL